MLVTHADVLSPAECCSKSKLYRFDHDAGEWKERGVGQVRLLQSKENKKIRLLHRQEKTLKIRANHIGAPLLCEKLLATRLFSLPDCQAVVRACSESDMRRPRALMSHSDILYLLILSDSRSHILKQALALAARHTFVSCAPAPCIQQPIRWQSDCNFRAVMPGTKLQEHTGNEKAWVWSAVDFADEVQKPELFCIRFASVDSKALLLHSMIWGSRKLTILTVSC